VSAIHLVAVRATSRTKTAAILSAEGVEWQVQDERVADQRLEVDVLVDDPVHVSVIVVAFAWVEEDVVDRHLHVRVDLPKATTTLKLDVTFDVPGHMDAVDECVEGQGEGEDLSGPNARERKRDAAERMLEPEVLGRAGTTQQLRDIYGE